MEEQNSLNLSELIENTLKTFFKILKEVSSLASLEAQLAKKSLAVIIVLSFLIGSFVTASWLSLQALIFFGLLAFHSSVLLALSLITLLNFIILGLIFFTIFKAKNNLFFPVTRKHLSAFTAERGGE